VKKTAERAGPTPLFKLTLAALALVAVFAVYWIGRTPWRSAPDTVRAFLDHARKGEYDEARVFCTPDLAPASIRDWMHGGFEYTMPEAEDITPSTADQEADIVKGGQRFTLRFSLFKRDNQWRINSMMVVK
jgi:hypothetical protein